MKLHLFFFFLLYFYRTMNLFAMEQNNMLYLKIENAIKKRDLEKLKELTASQDFNPNKVDDMGYTYLHQHYISSVYNTTNPILIERYSCLKSEQKKS